MWRRSVSTIGIGLAVASSLVLAACGDSGGPSTSITAQMADFEFTPTSWTVPANQEITIKLSNTGAVEHEWVLLRSGVRIARESDLPDTEEELLSEFVYWETELKPGDSKTLAFTAPAVGTYQVICAIENHFNAGMEAELTAE